MKLYIPLVLLAVGLASGYMHLENQVMELRPWVRAKAKELMKRDMLGDKDTHIYTLDLQMHKEIMREVIEEELTDKTLKLVLNFVGRQHENFLYSGYLKTFEVIEKKTLGDAAMFELAYKIKDDVYKGECLSLMNIFPVAVWSLMSSPTVCIKNRGYGEYFYAAETDLKVDEVRRQVFMWRPHNEAGKQGDWKFEHIEGNKFHIVNLRFKEFLYADESTHNNDAERRRIFTHITPWSAENTANVWEVEMDGEDVFIKNSLYGEYIYALDGDFYDKNRRGVFAWVPKGRAACDGHTYQCRWMLSVC